ncbi:hypothetical protein NL676_005704 [Syzygium grande]|nr:hypothetical protein NL676_005704 [Syzygium grande]
METQSVVETLKNCLWTVGGEHDHPTTVWSLQNSNREGSRIGPGKLLCATLNLDRKVRHTELDRRVRHSNEEGILPDRLFPLAVPLLLTKSCKTGEDSTIDRFLSMRSDNLVNGTPQD